MRLVTAIVLCLTAGSLFAANLPDVPNGAQAVTLSGKPLYSPAPGQAVLDNLAEAKKNYDGNPNDAENIIWYGRRIAYTGDFRGAIEVFSEGIEKFPNDDRPRGFQPQPRLKAAPYVGRSYATGRQCRRKSRSRQPCV